MWPFLFMQHHFIKTGTIIRFFFLGFGHIKGVIFLTEEPANQLSAGAGTPLDPLLYTPQVRNLKFRGKFWSLFIKPYCIHLGWLETVYYS